MWSPTLSTGKENFPCTPVILPHNLFLSLSLPFPFFASRPVSVYMSQLVWDLEEPRTPFLLSPLEQLQHALLKGSSGVRPIAGQETRQIDVLTHNIPVTSRLGPQVCYHRDKLINLSVIYPTDVYQKSPSWVKRSHLFSVKFFLFVTFNVFQLILLNFNFSKLL